MGSDGQVKGRRYVALDGLRGVAAGAVLLLHMAMFRHGYLAVDLFFMLSGFVIGAAYERRLRAAKFPLLDMLKIRVVRLWPMMALGSLFGLGVVEMQLRPMPSVPIYEALFRQLTFLPTLTPHRDLFQLDGVEWSLLAELGINLLHALFLRWLSLRVLFGVLTAALFALVWAAFQPDGLSGGWGYDNICTGFARVAFSYTAGLVLFRLHAAGRLPKVKIPVLLLMGAMPFGALAPQILPASDLLNDLGNIVILYPLVVCWRRR